MYKLYEDVVNDINCYTVWLYAWYIIHITIDIACIMVNLGITAMNFHDNPFCGTGPFWVGHTIWGGGGGGGGGGQICVFHCEYLVVKSLIMIFRYIYRPAKLPPIHQQQALWNHCFRRTFCNWGFFSHWNGVNFEIICINNDSKK